jgi:hypothetical protein
VSIGHPSEKVTLRYRLSVRAGLVSVSQVEKLSNTLTDTSLQDCLVDGLLRIRYRSAATDDIGRWMDQVVVLGDLMAAHGLALPAPEAYPAPTPAPE